ncbi:MAG: ABC transporter permease [Halobacteriota archaeon]
MDTALLLGCSVLISLSVLIATLATRNVAIFKMSIRNLVRHPKNTAIVLVALLIGTAIVSGSLVSSSSLDYVVVRAAYDALGNVDETVVSNSLPFNYSVYSKLTADLELKNNTDGISPSLSGQAPSVDDVTSGIVSTNVTLVGLDFDRDVSFGTFTLLNNTQTNASDLTSGEVLINSKLARDLDAHVGDRLTIYYGSSGPSAKAYTFTIKHIAKDEGKALYGLNKNIFMTLGAAQTVFQTPGQINEIRVSNVGNAEDGAAQSAHVSTLVREGLHNTSGEFAVNLVKHDMLQSAAARGALFSNVLIMLATFSVLASATLIANVFFSFSEDRKSELGLARAIGMKKRQTTLLFLFEGVACAVIAAAIGSILGVGIGAGIIAVLNAVFSSESTSEGALALHYAPLNLLQAFLVCLIVTIAAIAASAYRIGKLTIVNAIYDVPASKEKNSRRFSLTGAVLLIVSLAAYSTIHDAVVLSVFVPALDVFGICLLASKFVTYRRAFTVAGIILVLYNGYLITSEAFSFSEASAVLAFTGHSTLFLMGIVLVVLLNSTVLLRGIARFLGRFTAFQPVLRPSIAYSLQKRATSAVGTTVLSLAIFFLVVGAVTATIYQPDINKQTGGYDIRATSSVPLSNLTMLQVQSNVPQLPNTQIALLNESQIEFYDGLYVTPSPSLLINDQSVNQTSEPGAVYGIDANFSTHAQYSFKSTLEGFNDSEAVWASLNNPYYAVVDSSYEYGANATAVKAGDLISLKVGNNTARFVVAGVLDEFYLHGVFLSKQQMAHYFPSAEGDRLFLIKSEAGMKPIELSYDLKKGYKAAGIDAFLIRDELRQMTQQYQMLFEFVATYLTLGFIVAISSVGVITTRSIRERRKEIGVLRAIGYNRRRIVRSLLLEATFATTLASIIGLSAGLVVSYAIYLSLNQALKTAFAVPVWTLLLIIGVVYVATTACTIGPARNISRSSPAEAIRRFE